MMKSVLLLEIPKRNSACDAGGESLTPGMEYYSVLTEKDGGYTRQDFCMPCWLKGAKDHALSMKTSCWKSKVLENKKEPLKTYDKQQKALVLFEEGKSASDFLSLAKQFVLALYLARKKVIFFRKEMAEADGRVIMLYEVAGTDEVIPVVKINLSQIEIEETRQALAKELS